MSLVLAWIFLKSVTFVTSTFSETETFYISLSISLSISVCNECHDISLRAITLADIKIITVKGLQYRVVSNKTYDECYHFLESNSSTDKFGSF